MRTGAATFMRGDHVAPDRPAGWWRGGPATLLLGSLAVISLVAAIAPAQDPDLWWHLRTGQWILAHGRLPEHDLYTYTVPTHLWVDHEYLTEVLMWLLFARTGLLGLSLAFGIVTWVGFLFLLLTMWREGVPYVITGLALALAIVAGAPIWGPRPQVITFTFSCIELYALRRFLAGSGRAIFCLPVLVALWANLHGGWPIAFAFLGAAIAAAGWCRLTGRDREVAGSQMAGLAGVTAACAAATLLTPHGLAVYLAPLGPLTSHAQQGLIQEWQHADFRDRQLWPLGVMTLLLGLGAAASRRGLFGPGAPLGFVASLGTLVMALLSVRNTALFVAAGAPALASAWGAVWLRSRARRGLPWPERTAPTRRGAAISALALVVVAVITVAALARSLRQQDLITRSQYPVGAANWLAAHPGTGTRMFNEYGWGGYLIYRLYPNPSRRVFIFGEATVMGDDQLYRFARVDFVRPGWRQELDAAGVDYAVLRPGSALARALSRQPGWKLAYRDATAAIYLRDAGAAAPGRAASAANGAVGRPG